jgi:hypothetical protein
MGSDKNVNFIYFILFYLNVLFTGQLFDICCLLSNAVIF